MSTSGSTLPHPSKLQGPFNISHLQETNLSNTAETGFSTKLHKSRNYEFVSYQRNILKYLGYFGISTARILKNTTIAAGHSGQYYTLTSNTLLGTFMYGILHINVTIKAIFLGFLVSGYFGPVDFLDQIASLDYILCSGLVVIGAFVFLLRYPFYEVLLSTWKLLNSIYLKLGCPQKLQQDMNKLQKFILINHLFIIFGGCTALMIQYFPDPKYCNFTYSTFEFDNPFLRIIFGVHEFFFMMMAWNGYAGPSSLCIFQGIAISTIINKMNGTLQMLYRGEMKAEHRIETGRGYRLIVTRNKLHARKVAPSTEYCIDTILRDYRQLMLVCDRFNESVAYKTLFLHICGGSQFVSDVFAATHVLRLPGTGFMDVWFYVWDCMSAGFMLLRVYQFMGVVSDESEMFLATFKEYLTFPNPKRLLFRKIEKTLRIVSLNVGPCKVWPETLLTVLDTMGNYYVCAALW